MSSELHITEKLELDTENKIEPHALPEMVPDIMSGTIRCINREVLSERRADIVIRALRELHSDLLTRPDIFNVLLKISNDDGPEMLLDIFRVILLMEKVYHRLSGVKFEEVEPWYSIAKLQVEILTYNSSLDKGDIIDLYRETVHKVLDYLKTSEPSETAVKLLLNELGRTLNLTIRERELCRRYLSELLNILQELESHIGLENAGLPISPEEAGKLIDRAVNLIENVSETDKRVSIPLLLLELLDLKEVDLSRLFKNIENLEEFMSSSKFKRVVRRYPKLARLSDRLRADLDKLGQIHADIEELKELYNLSTEKFREYFEKIRSEASELSVNQLAKLLITIDGDKPELSELQNALITQLESEIKPENVSELLKLEPQELSKLLSKLQSTGSSTLSTLLQTTGTILQRVDREHGEKLLRALSVLEPSFELRQCVLELIRSDYLRELYKDMLFKLALKVLGDSFIRKKLYKYFGLTYGPVANMALDMVIKHAPELYGKLAPKLYSKLAKLAKRKPSNDELATLYIIAGDYSKAISKLRQLSYSNRCKPAIKLADTLINSSEPIPTSRINVIPRLIELADKCIDIRRFYRLGKLFADSKPESSVQKLKRITDRYKRSAWTVGTLSSLCK